MARAQLTRPLMWAGVAYAKGDTLSSLSVDDVIGLVAKGWALDLDGVAAVRNTVPAQLATDAGGGVIGFASSVCFRDNAAHASTVTGADETVLSVTIPAAALRADSLLRITTLWSCTNSANSKAFRILADGQSVLSVSQTTVASFHDMHIVRFRSMSSQVTNNSATSSPFGTTASTGVTTLTVDATDGITLTFVINRSNAGDAAALESAIVEVF